MSLKYLYLVRHGQYDMDKNSTTYGSLNQMGHYQANCIAKRLSELPITKIHASTVKRAQETAQTIQQVFPQLDINSQLLLKEGLPFVPASVVKKKKLDKAQIKSDKERMENAYNMFFKSNRKEKDKHEVLVCHGNIIRYFICRCLGVSIEAWSNFEIFECSLSVVKISPNKRILVNSVGENGHIPLLKRTLL